MACPAGSIRPKPTPPVPFAAGRQQPHEFAQLAIFPRPEHQMPVIGHQAIGADPHRPRAERFLDYALEREVVGIFLEERSATDAAV